ncbi:MAG TPA: polyphosphate polymerase domain-containing protein [Planctomycetes bacterium]|nr:polyphosphate polymerase domain-containing protein [Planctomycetota bacterium]HIJ70434.1 polyphosphate polymerase domain-containing protein [Planctomycetota bacterium]
MVAGGLPKKDTGSPADSVRLKSRVKPGAPAPLESRPAPGTRKGSKTAVPEKNLFCRYELKYYICEAKARAIEQFIKPYIHLDRYSKLQPDGAYPIVSLYLDSWDFRLCRESMIGKKNRFKLRVRSYDDDTGTPYFFEIKRRLNNIIIKSRTRVTYDNMVGLLTGGSVPQTKYKADEQTLRQFQLYMQCINAVPAIRIRYKRKAFEDDSDNRVRVTFDRWLCHNAESEPIVLYNGAGWQRHKFNNVILEIKFTARYPAWLSRMVKYFDLRRESISKYATSVKHACSMGFCAPNLSV